ADGAQGARRRRPGLRAGPRPDRAGGPGRPARRPPDGQGGLPRFGVERSGPGRARGADVGRRERTPPTAEEYEGWRTRFSNWERWGAGDELGTLHHITPEVRTRAAGLVREGRSVSVARPIDTKPSAVNPHPAHHFVAVEGAGGIADYIGLF